MKHLYIYFSLLSILLLTACSDNTNEQVEIPASDDMRIISLMPSNTEIIAELDAAEHLAGITTTDNYPEDLSSDLTRFDTFALDEETMMALKPTHIVSHEANHNANKDIIDRVASNTGAKILIVEDAAEIEQIYSTITDIGEFINKNTEADQLNAELREETAAIQNQYSNQAPQDKALILVSTTPDVYIAGSKTFIDSFLEILNIENVYQDINGYPAVTSEDLIAREPGFVISTLGISSEELKKSLNNISGLESTPVTQPENQCAPDPDLVSRPGPRFTEGLAAIAECIYE